MRDIEEVREELDNLLDERAGYMEKIDRLSPASVERLNHVEKCIYVLDWMLGDHPQGL